MPGEPACRAPDDWWDGAERGGGTGGNPESEHAGAPPVKPRVLNAEPDRYSPRARAALQEVAEVVEEALDREALLRRVPDFDALIVRLAHRVDREVLAAGTRLRAVATATTGLDHVDLAAARERGVEVLSLRGEHEFLRSVSATAEHTWALLLALLRHIPAAHHAASRGEWDRDRFRGRELEGKRLGVLGLGRIGAKVADYGRAFGMEVRAYDRYLEAWPDGVGCAESLDALLAWSDVLTVHVPLNEDTRGMLGARQLARMPKGSWLVNTSRGAVVSGQDLVDALRAGHLAGAAVDVVEGETEPGGPAQDPLVRYAREHDALLVTPHVGGATAESMEKTEVFMARKLAGFLARQRTSSL